MRQLTKRQKLVLRMLSLVPGGTSMAFLIYSLTGKYPKQTKGEVSQWKNTFSSLRRRRLVCRQFDYSKWNWGLTQWGFSIIHKDLARSQKHSLEM
jgi:hypothetical protein